MFGISAEITGSIRSTVQSLKVVSMKRHIYMTVRQPLFDPASYYAQFYRDGDGRMSPFHSTKYNGNVPVMSSQSSQEVCISHQLHIMATNLLFESRKL